MGRIVDLCGEVAAAVDEGPDGFVLSAEAREQLLEDWTDEDVEDALGLVSESFFQSELVEAADSLSARLLEVLGDYGEEDAFATAVQGEARIAIDVIRQLAHRLDRLEEILDVFRDEAAPDRRGFDALQRRLIDQGIEAEMRPGCEPRVDAAIRDGDDPEE